MIDKRGGALCLSYQKKGGRSDLLRKGETERGKRMDF